MPADRIIQEIVLTGDEKLLAKMEALGVAGTRAMKSVQVAATGVVGVTGTLDKSLVNVTNRFSQLHAAAATTGERIGIFQTRLTSTITTVAKLTAGLALAGGGFLALMRSAGKTAEQIEKGSQAAGITADQYQTLKGAFEVAGVEGEEFGGFMNRMNRTMAESDKQAGELAQAQRDLTTSYVKGEVGIDQYEQQMAGLQRTARDSTNVYNKLGVSASTVMNDPREAALQLADAFSRMPEGIAKSALEMELFGRTGTRNAVILNKGREGIIALEKEVARVAPPLQKRILDIAGAFDDAFDFMKLAADNLRIRLSAIFMPSMTRLVQAITNALVAQRAAFEGLATAIASRLEPIIEDLIKLLSGETLPEDSFVKQAADAVIGFGQVVKVVFTGIGVVLTAFAAAWKLVTAVTGEAFAIGVAIAYLTGTFGLLTSAIGVVVSSVGLMIRAFQALQSVVSFVGLLASPWALVVAAIVAVLAVLALLAYKYWPEIQAAAQATWDFLTTGIAALWTFIADKWTAGVAYINGLWESVKAKAAETWASITTPIIGALDNVIGKVKEIVDWFKEWLAYAKKVGAAMGGSGGGSPQGYARGGMVRGPGSSTGDRVPIMASAGEFVMPFKAVSKYGTAFMEALRSMSFDGGGLSGMIDSVPLRVPAMAGGGGLGGNVLNLTIDREAFNGLRADDETMERLTKFSLRQQMRRGGRKPAWLR